MSPDPDLHVYEIDVVKDRCLVLATDGAWNVLTPETTIQGVWGCEKNNEAHMISPEAGHSWVNPSKNLVDKALERWSVAKLRADNTSIVTVMLDPPGPPRAQVLRRLHGVPQVPAKPTSDGDKKAPALPPKPTAKEGIAIISRFPNSKDTEESEGTNMVGPAAANSQHVSAIMDKNCSRGNPALGKARAKTPVLRSPNPGARIVHDSMKNAPQRVAVKTTEGPAMRDMPQVPRHRPVPGTEIQVNEVSSSDSERTPPPPLPARAHKASCNAQKPVLEQRSMRSRTQSGPQGNMPILGGRKMSRSEVPPLPVKRPRRSVVPEYNSDSENQPESKKATSPFSDEKIARILRSTRRSCAALDSAVNASAPQPRSANTNSNSRRSGGFPLASASNRSDAGAAAANEKRVLRSANPANESPMEPKTKVSPRVSTRSSRSSIVMPPQPLIQQRGHQTASKVTTATRSPTGKLRSKSTAELTSSGMKRKRRSDLAPTPMMLRGQAQQKTPTKVNPATSPSPSSAVKKARVLRNK